MMPVHILKARVLHGWLVLEGAAGALFQLSEGDTIELISVDELLLSGGALSDEDHRAALDRELDASFIDEETSELHDVAEALAELRKLHAPDPH